MPIPSSGAISINDIRNTFGGSAGQAFLDYYAGGAFVPSGTSGVNGAVPTSGALDIFHFYGTGKTVKVFLTSGTSYTTPANWNPSNNSIEIVSSGSKGGNVSPVSQNAGSGGAGGGYAKLVNWGVAASTSLTVSFGANGVGTWISNTGSAPTTTAQGCFASAGTLATNIGTTTALGGNGSAGGPSVGYKGAGGGAAGPNGAGSTPLGGQAFGGSADGGTVAGGNAFSTGSSGTEFDATHGCGGGTGSTVIANGLDGSPGADYGGGGGGASGDAVSAWTGGAGGAGLIVITYFA